MSLKKKEITEAAEAIAKLKKLYPHAKDSIVSMLVILQRLEPSEAGNIRALIVDNPSILENVNQIKMKVKAAEKIQGKEIETGCKGCGSNETVFVPLESKQESEEVKGEIESLFNDLESNNEEKPKQLSKRGRKKQTEN